MLEMLRNVLDMLQKDEVYKKRTDAMYRKRVMETHVRRLPVFEDLSDEDFEKLKQAIDLVEFDSGETIFGEGEPSDCFYVIRSGLVKVIKNAWYEFRPDEFKPDYWKNLGQEVHDSEDEDADMREAVKEMLSEDAQTALEAAKGGKAISAEQQTAIIKSLNEFIREAKLHEQLGKTRKEVLDIITGPQLEATIAEYAKDTKKWSVLEYRTFHRVLLERLFPTGLPRQLDVRRASPHAGLFGAGRNHRRNGGVFHSSQPEKRHLHRLRSSRQRVSTADSRWPHGCGSFPRGVGENQPGRVRANAENLAFDRHENSRVNYDSATASTGNPGSADWGSAAGFPRKVGTLNGWG